MDHSKPQPEPLKAIALVFGCLLGAVLFFRCGEDGRAPPATKAEKARAQEVEAEEAAPDKAQANQAHATEATVDGAPRNDLLWLARANFVEAPPPSRANTSYEMSLISNTILERRDDPSCPSTVEGVVREKYQYTGIHKAERGVMQLTLPDYNNRGLPAPRLHMWRRAVRVAQATLTAPDSLRPPAANSYANTEVSGRKPWMTTEAFRYSSESHSFYEVPTPCRNAGHNLTAR